MRIVRGGGRQRTLTDLTGDVITTPSIGMLDAIRRATLNDDVYGEDQTTSAFEREMAAICGKEAAAFVITGTMANQLALRTLLNEAPPYAIMTDAQSRKPLPPFLVPSQGTYLAVAQRYDLAQILTCEPCRHRPLGSGWRGLH